MKIMIQEIKEIAVAVLAMAVATAVVLTIASLFIGVDALNHINGL
jgi:hypothetical protein|tara:strand:- start:389 stop:523 length:135 start_codon:yes stop_codon:yes gene_type:complete